MSAKFQIVLVFAVLFMSTNMFGSYSSKYILFEKGSSELTEQGQAEIKNLINILNEQPFIQEIEISGHQDSLEMGSSDKTLSYQRTVSVLNEINKSYSGKTTFVIKALSSEPLGSYPNESSTALNRRVTFYITKYQKPSISLSLNIDSSNNINSEPLLNAIRQLDWKTTSSNYCYVFIPFYTNDNPLIEQLDKAQKLYKNRKEQITSVIKTHLNSSKIYYEDNDYLTSSKTIIVEIFSILE